MRSAWPKLDHVFSVRRSDGNGESEASPEPTKILREPHRLPKELLNNFPVDLLTIEQGDATKPPLSFEQHPWEKLISRTSPENRPRVVIESWPPNAQLWTKGPACKSTTSRWHDLNYVSRFKRVSATDVGGAINQSRLLVARVKHEWSHLWVWSTEETELDTARPMSTLLTPPGLVRSNTYVQGRSGDPIAQRDPMPSVMGAFIQTERGTRRLTPEESSRGLGVPKEWKVDPTRITKGLLARTTTLFHWEYLSATLSRPARPTTIRPGQKSPSLSWSEMRNRTRPEPTAVQVPFAWKPPDLQEGGIWFNQRMSNLRKASESFEDPTSVIDEGIEAINIYRQNYTKDGPEAKRL